MKIEAAKRLSTAADANDAGEILTHLTKILGKPKSKQVSQRDGRTIQDVEWQDKDCEINLSLDLSRGSIEIEGYIYGLLSSEYGEDSVSIDVKAKNSKDFYTKFSKELQDGLKESDKSIKYAQKIIDANKKLNELLNKLMK